jgi:hypothetical protein
MCGRLSEGHLFLQRRWQQEVLLGIQNRAAVTPDLGFGCHMGTRTDGID